MALLRIAYVVSARDQNLVDDAFDQIAKLCNHNGIPFFEKNKPASLLSTYTFAISWRWLINDVENLIVLHDSLLPKYRGFAPLPTALIKGEDKIGVTALFADEEFDRGDILGQKQTSVSYPIKIKAAIELVSRLYSDLVVEIGGQVLRGERLVGTSKTKPKSPIRCGATRRTIALDGKTTRPPLNGLSIAWEIHIRARRA